MPLEAKTPMHRILIVDDHADIRRLIRMTLEFAGCGAEVIEACDGATAISLARSLEPDLVLTDVMMPGRVSGLDLCRELKADPRLSGIAVVMISASGRTIDHEAGMAAGAEAYLVKPFSPLELIRTLERAGVTA